MSENGKPKDLDMDGWSVEAVHISAKGYTEFLVHVHSCDGDLSLDQQRRLPCSFDEIGFVDFYESLQPFYEMAVGDDEDDEGGNQ